MSRAIVAHTTLLESLALPIVIAAVWVAAKEIGVAVSANAVVVAAVAVVRAGGADTARSACTWVRASVAWDPAALLEIRDAACQAHALKAHRAVGVVPTPQCA